MTSGIQITERDKHCVLRMHAQGRFSKSEIARACGVSRPVVIKIIDDFAATAWQRQEQLADRENICSRDP